MSEEEKKDFQVRDRRIFSDENADAQEKSENTDAEEGATPDADAESQAFRKAAEEGQAKAGMPLPEINFATFIFSLHSSVLMQLGIVAEPNTGEKTKNLPAAKQTIDILGMLEQKTRGNLTDEEEKMLKSILYDLRMIYVREIS